MLQPKAPEPGKSRARLLTPSPDSSTQKARAESKAPDANTPGAFLPQDNSGLAVVRTSLYVGVTAVGSGPSRFGCTRVVRRDRFVGIVARFRVVVVAEQLTRV